MATIVKLLSFLTFLSLVNYISAISSKEGLNIIKKSTASNVGSSQGDTCQLTSLGPGKDDTDNVGSIVLDTVDLMDYGEKVLAAISHCGVGGTTIFSPGNFNITR
jgi:hypothetical protein